jgi:hypothetical protein
MPGYGIAAADTGGGLLPWEWAATRLERSEHYWLATICPDGRPHTMPVWGIWDDFGLVLSSSARSRRARNLALDPRCTVTNDDPHEPVVVEGVAALVTEPAAIAAFATAINSKHSVDHDVSFYLSPDNVCLRVDAVRAFGLTDANFTGSPTRWVLR